jgi:hypothetical protein
MTAAAHTLHALLALQGWVLADMGPRLTATIQRFDWNSFIAATSRRAMLTYARSACLAPGAIQQAILLMLLRHGCAQAHDVAMLLCCCLEQVRPFLFRMVCDVLACAAARSVGCKCKTSTTGIGVGNVGCSSNAFVAAAGQLT